MSTVERLTAADTRGPDNRGSGHQLSRRRLVGIASGTLAAPLVPGAVARAAQQGAATPEPGTPVSRPAATAPVDIDALLSVSGALVGSENLNRDAAEPLAQLIGADPARVSGFQELTRIDDLTAREALSGLPDDASTVARDILQYWYLGQFDGQPVGNRAELFFRLASWQAVPYSTQPTLCKSFGYWATDPGVEDSA